MAREFSYLPKLGRFFERDTERRRFPAPEPKPPRSRVHPVFLSFRGCPARCVFCAQELQSGHGERPLSDILAGLAAELDGIARDRGGERELAFYGGTFTMLPLEEQLAYLDLAARYRNQGLVTKVRASTRPDAVDAGLLRRLKNAGLDMLELGVQSFCDAPLAASTRGYTGQDAVAGCLAVRDAGLELGIQLMPGMPGMREEDFVLDTDITASLSPATLRLYPCLVLAGTRLAALYRSGDYAPWALDRVIPLLADAQRSAWDAGIRVIRIGLAPQAELEAGGILAGPSHPALGSMVRGHALFRYIADQIAAMGRPARHLAMPRRFQGEFWGHKGALKADYAALGLRAENVSWHDGEECELF